MIWGKNKIFYWLTSWCHKPSSFPGNTPSLSTSMQAQGSFASYTLDLISNENMCLNRYSVLICSHLNPNIEIIALKDPMLTPLFVKNQDSSNVVCSIVDRPGIDFLVKSSKTIKWALTNFLLAAQQNMQFEKQTVLYFILHITLISITKNYCSQKAPTTPWHLCMTAVTEEWHRNYTKEQKHGNPQNVFHGVDYNKNCKGRSQFQVRIRLK